MKALIKYAGILFIAYLMSSAIWSAGVKVIKTDVKIKIENNISNADGSVEINSSNVIEARGSTRVGPGQSGQVGLVYYDVATTNSTIPLNVGRPPTISIGVLTLNTPFNNGKVGPVTLKQNGQRTCIYSSDKPFCFVATLNGSNDSYTLTLTEQK